ncbi:MAG: type II toxin-antitoxin system RelE/ParE family toxin [Patescibacteria group bacterium]
MLEIFATNEFEERYRKLPVIVRKKAEKQEILFRENPFYPSLHTEKLEPKGKQVWSFRVDKKYRIFFRFLEENKVLFLTVGPHDWIYKLRF